MFFLVWEVTTGQTIISSNLAPLGVSIVNFKSASQIIGGGGLKLDTAERVNLGSWGQTEYWRTSEIITAFSGSLNLPREGSPLMLQYPSLGGFLGPIYLTLP